MEYPNVDKAVASEVEIGGLMTKTNDKDFSHTESSKVEGYEGMPAGDASESDDDK